MNSINLSHKVSEMMAQKHYLILSHVGPFLVWLCEAAQ